MSPAGRTTGLALHETDAGVTAAAVLHRLGVPDPSHERRPGRHMAGLRVEPSSAAEPHAVKCAPAATFLPRTVVLTPAQIEAVERASRVLSARGGVLLADRTGTGKTFLALALIERALSNGCRRVLVTGPAALAAQWTPLLRRAAGAWGGRLLTCRGPTIEPPTRPVVAWLSHAMLSLARWPAAVDGSELIVVDEAHAFRNPSTRRHRSLAWLCRSSRVVLLSATPVNNSLMDLYFLYRLFIGDGALDDLGVPDLEAAFRVATEAGGGAVRPPLDAAIDALTVRTRTDRTAQGHTSHRDGISGRPRVEPVAVRYDLDADGRGTARLVDGVRRLDLSAYGVIRAGGAPVGGELVRFGLVKRLESSVAAFSASARGLRRYLEAFADAVTAGFWLSPATHRAFTANDPGQLLLAPLALPRLPPGCDPERLAASAMADAAILRVLSDCAMDQEARDRKVEVLAALLVDGLADRKVLVFTEFRDTALHLWKVIGPRVRVGLIHGSKAMVGNAPAGRLEVVRRFAPHANGAAFEPVERVDVLIATDVLAEGFNLQDAADVVSYDLPWNPVRLIQRIGRIDRNGSPHTLVRCHNFIPDRTLDLYLGLVDRIRSKLDTIRAGPGRTVVYGPFAGIATPDTTDGSRTGGRWRPRLDGLHRRPAAPVAAAVRSTALLRRLGDGEPGLFDAFETAADPIAGLGFPGLDAVCAGPAARRTWIVAVTAGPRSARLILVRSGSGRPHVRPDRLRAVRLLGAIRSGRLAARAWVQAGEEEIPVTGGHWSAAAAAIAAVERCLRDEQPAALPTGRTGRTGRRSVLIRRLLRLLAREPGRPDPLLIERVDRLVPAIREGLRAGMETAVEASITRAAAERRWRPGRTARLVTELESLVASIPGAADAGATAGNAPEPIAVFELG